MGGATQALVYGQDANGAMQPAGYDSTGKSVNVIGLAYMAVVSASFVRPADTTPYTAGDLIANSVTAGSVVPLSWTAARVAAGSMLLRRTRVRRNKTATPTSNAAVRIHLFKAAPTTAVGDNTSLGMSGTGQITGMANYLGYVDVTIDQAFADGGVGVGWPAGDIQIVLASGQTIYGLLEDRSGMTPASAETFTVELELMQA